MPHDITGPILLVCDDERRSYEIMRRLHQAGLGVVGPVTSAAQAMVLAGQESSTVAVVAGWVGVGVGSPVFGTSGPITTTT